MGKESKSMTSEEIYAEPVKGILEMSISANRITSVSGSGENSYEIRNALILADRKNKICYENGRTMPASAQAFQNDAERAARHSRILHRNMQRAYPAESRPQEVDTHHIAARLDMRAWDSRRFLFNWGIAINDADNGVYLPRYRHTKIASMPNATNHQGVHTDIYYFAVETRLRAGETASESVGRLTLRKIKAELIAGIFPF